MHQSQTARLRVWDATGVTIRTCQCYIANRVIVCFLSIHLSLYIPFIFSPNKWVAGKRCSSIGVVFDNMRRCNAMKSGAQLGLDVLAFNGWWAAWPAHGRGRDHRLPSPQFIFYSLFMYFCFLSRWRRLLANNCFTQSDTLNFSIFMLFNFILPMSKTCLIFNVLHTPLYHSPTHMGLITITIREKSG